MNIKDITVSGTAREITLTSYECAIISQHMSFIKEGVLLTPKASKELLDAVNKMTVLISKLAGETPDLKAIHDDLFVDKTEGKGKEVGKIELPTELSYKQKTRLSKILRNKHSSRIVTNETYKIVDDMIYASYELVHSEHNEVRALFFSLETLEDITPVMCAPVFDACKSVLRSYLAIETDLTADKNSFDLLQSKDKNTHRLCFRDVDGLRFVGEVNTHTFKVMQVTKQQ